MEVKRPFKLVCIGGTFSPLHIGHLKLFDIAFKLGDTVLIGLTSDDMVRRKELSSKIEGYRTRERKLREALERRGYAGRFQVVELRDPLGSAVYIRDLEAIVATEETLPNAIRINRERRRRGLEELVVVVVPYARDELGRRISSTRIRRGEIDEWGRVRCSSTSSGA
ncbi:MAG: phosphopantetheine adenylyltransferase [Thermoproteota archaeon]|nr:MAG: phosphopantetheine adenylyltransferase [Candidatus Korarchaeota archaeon]